MIISLLFDLVYAIVSIFTSGISIPSLPEKVFEVLEQVCMYIGNGIGVLSNYCHIGYLLTLFGIVVMVDMGIFIYKMAMFIIRKIPMINIS